MANFGGFLSPKAPAVTLTGSTMSATTTSAAETRAPSSDTESLHSLLLSLDHKISGVDGIKELAGRLFDPVTKVLSALEAQKSENITLQNSLRTNRAAYDELRNKMSGLEKHAGSLERENLALRQDFAESKTIARALETKSVAYDEQIADLEGKLSQETTTSKSLRDEIRVLRERLNDADYRLADLTAAIHSSRRKADLLEDEKHTLQSALSRANSDVARLSRRLAEAERSLGTVQGSGDPEAGQNRGDRTPVSSVVDELTQRLNIKAAS
jgi:chromosome segregation ATPase